MTDDRNDDFPIEASLLTGFLGSGKTTLLNRLITRPGMGEVAVLINEFGEVGLDHHLLEKVDENLVLMGGGCLCCATQGDLERALIELVYKRKQGEIPPFRRALIESSGLADPAPTIHALMTNDVVAAHYGLDAVIATVDAVNGARQLDSHRESVKQAAMADRIVLTKTDLAEPAAIQALEARLGSLNPGAPIIRAVMGEVDPALLFDAGFYDPATRSLDVQRWLAAEAYRPVGDQHDHAHEHPHDHRHEDGVHAVCLVREAPFDWDVLVKWVRRLIVYHGDEMLRVKGIVAVAGKDHPLAIHGIHHLWHDPVPLPRWPDDDRRSRIVFILRDLAPETVETALKEVEEEVAAAG